MNAQQRLFLKETMDLAWGLYRAELRGPDPRTFAQSLAGAWRWMKGAAARKAAAPAWARGTHARTMSLGSMVQSPIRRSLSGAAYAGRRSWEAGRTTTRIGA
ncbi:MAG TPA: hypothetical protein VFE10_10370 [Phenylobacterium sp.]|jgi:hypothetical protein|nr:hypothetical protein [Phenylobacterium sp.]